jgi:hypothetical protein
MAGTRPAKRDQLSTGIVEGNFARRGWFLQGFALNFEALFWE